MEYETHLKLTRQGQVCITSHRKFTGPYACLLVLRKRRPLGGTEDSSCFLEPTAASILFFWYRYYGCLSLLLP
jgi:hypothetical protein